MAQALTARRVLLVQMLEDQMKCDQNIYNHLDNKIAYFGKTI